MTLDPLADAQTLYAAYLAAEVALVNGTVASYSIGGRSFVKNDLDKLRKERRLLSDDIQRLSQSGGSIRLRGAVPL